MIVKSLKIVLSLVMLGIVQQGIAQDTIIISDYIENTTSGKVKIIQSDSLRNRLIPKPIVEVAEGSGEVKKAVGYRIQVFSDNNQRTAKAQAQARERNISVQFPELRVYRLYKSPSWRVRVGDFKTRNEAEQVMQEIKEAFPAYASEVTIVVDKINLRER